MIIYPSWLGPKGRIAVGEVIKSRAPPGSIGKLGCEDHDAVLAIRPEADALDLRVSRDKCSWSHRTGEANLEERPTTPAT
jgi:hypothetical protein